MRARIVTSIAAVGLLLAGCGGDDGEETEQAQPTDDSNASGETEGSDDDGGADEQMRSVTVGALPIVPTTALQLGIDQGFFTEHGIDVTLELGQGGAALLPAVVAGEIDFVVGQPLPLMLARDQGLDLRVVTGFSASKPEGDDINGVFSAEGSDIQSAADLAGQRVAVNTLNGAGDVTIREAVRQDGGDAESVQFVELPFPNMPAALQQGDVDAVWIPEPFVTTLVDDGAQLVTYNYQAVAPGLDTMVTFTGGELADADPELVEDFVAAMDQSLTYAEENPEQVRETMVDFLDMDPALAERVAIETFTSEVNVDALQTLGELAVQDGLLDESPDLDTMLH
ncbi:ABC transporter substrate-binding protein [Phytoactinopolyspora halotolerans]|uniref:ABC transporter substrate-binding protein n=1 Tax=Phytoactinopolyspora halotolerans TaxID=1981512 RepID=A0A6L9S3S3_9ACTN|nr:ABC transporter substrate-binding protein [Phytoactinopolyspora halotolerans]NED99077.1 ABC transporter substrate-binding protein [Phytoactinopolyspora halotolerans]